VLEDIFSQIDLGCPVSRRCTWPAGGVRTGARTNDADPSSIHPPLVADRSLASQLTTTTSIKKYELYQHFPYRNGGWAQSLHHGAPEKNARPRFAGIQGGYIIDHVTQAKPRADRTKDGNQVKEKRKI
jgi:hypothetical protein